MNLFPSTSEHETFTLAEGRVTITYPAKLSEESLRDMKDYLDIFLRKAQRVGHDPVDEMRPIAQAVFAAAKHEE
jgi:hypothetical protein